jgi:hypothetical protein
MTKVYVPKPKIPKADIGKWENAYENIGAIYTDEWLDFAEPYTDVILDED